MGSYRRILLAIDLTEESAHVTRRALALARAFESEVHLVHVIEPLSLAYGGDVPMDLSAVQEQIQSQAKSQLTDFARCIGIPGERQHLVFGRPETEIHRLARELSIGLVVIGSHGRHGLALLLGSTANSVLHGAPCDVLAVRVGSDAPQEVDDSDERLRDIDPEALQTG
jgi:universal stress protein A